MNGEISRTYTIFNLFLHFQVIPWSIICHFIGVGEYKHDMCVECECHIMYMNVYFQVHSIICTIASIFKLICHDIVHSITAIITQFGIRYFMTHGKCLMNVSLDIIFVPTLDYMFFPLPSVCLIHWFLSLSHLLCSTNAIAWRKLVNIRYWNREACSFF